MCLKLETKYLKRNKKSNLKSSYNFFARQKRILFMKTNVEETFKMLGFEVEVLLEYDLLTRCTHCIFIFTVMNFWVQVSLLLFFIL